MASAHTCLLPWLLLKLLLPLPFLLLVFFPGLTVWRVMSDMLVLASSPAACTSMESMEGDA